MKPTPPSQRPGITELELDDWDLRQEGLLMGDLMPEPIPRVVAQKQRLEEIEESLDPPLEEVDRQKAFLVKCLAFVDLSLKETRESAAYEGRIATGEEQMRVAMARVSELPIDMDRYQDFFARYIAKAIRSSEDIGESRDEGNAEDDRPAPAIKKFQLERKRVRPNYLPEALSLEEIGGPAPSGKAVRLEPIDEDLVGSLEAQNFVHQVPEPDSQEMTWGRNAIDQGLGTLRFDEGRAVLEEVQSIPALGNVLFNKEGRFRSRFFRWATLCSVILGFCGLGYILLRFINRRGEEPSTPTTALPAELFRVPHIPNIESTIRDYLSATDWRQQLAFVREPAEVEPKMREWYATHPWKPVSFTKVKRAHLEIIHGLPCVAVSAEVSQPSAARFFVLETVGEQQYKIDWEFAELYQAVPWDRFSESQTQEPTEMRCILKPGDYFNWGFSDNKKWDSWILIEPEQKFPALHGYVEKDSADGRKLKLLYDERTFRKAYPAFMVILSLAYPSEVKDSKQVRILNIVDAAPIRKFAGAP